MFVVSPDPVGQRRPDVFVGSIGYEARSTFAMTRLGSRRRTYMFAYDASETLGFWSRVEQAKKIDARVVPARTDADFRTEFASLVGELELGRVRRLGIDISSMGRRRIADVVELLEKSSLATRRGFVVEFYYVPAVFRAPAEHVSESLVADPVSPRFVGQLRSLSLPASAVIGLGYEPSRAIGVFDLLEPYRTWAFLPVSNMPYEIEILRANRLLLGALPESDLVEYPVMDPPTAYKKLESLVRAASDSARMVLVPMGPKIFALSCMLLAIDPRIPAPAVWRVGERVGAMPQEVDALGPIVGLEVHFLSGAEHD